MTDIASETALIHLVDDDAAMRRSLVYLLDSVGWQAVAHESAKAFLAAYQPGNVACLVLDVRMPDMSGLELQRELGGHDCNLPVVFITGHAEVGMAVDAMKAGAFDFIEKPFSDQRLLDVIAAAIRESRRRLHAVQRQQQAGTRLAHLSQRELEVARKVALGLPNKVVARELAISEKTVQAHRRNVMDKAGVSSAAELTRMLMIADPGFAAELETSKS